MSTIEKKEMESKNNNERLEETDDLLDFLMNDDDKAGSKTEAQMISHEEGGMGSEDEYEYTDSSSESEDIQIILNADDQIAAEKRLDQSAEGVQDGLVHIPDEDTKSAFDIDINKLKLRKWEMTGDESDYFNYGMNESMWKDYVHLINRRRGRVNIKELRELSDNLIMQGTYLPYSSSVAHNSSRSYHSYHDSSNLNQQEMEQFYSLINNPDTIKEVMKKINEQQDGQSGEPRKEEPARHTSRHRQSPSRSRHHSGSVDRSRSRRRSRSSHYSHRSQRHRHHDRESRYRRRDSSDQSSDESDRKESRYSSSKNNDGVDRSRDHSSKRYRR